MFYGILGEDRSDANTLKVLVRRLNERALANKKRKKAKRKLKIKAKNYHGWSELCRKGARDLKALERLGCDRFIVCVDADGPDPISRYQYVWKVVIVASEVSVQCCLVIPVQELEAWILADLEQAAPIVIPSWTPSPILNPERQSSPKEHLRRLSRDPATGKARYNEVIHNERMAEYLRLEQLSKKCESFRVLEAFVAG